MADEPLIDYKKPGFPQTENNEKSYLTRIEYVGPTTILQSAEPAANDPWGDYDGRVRSTTLTPLEQTDYSELIVEVEFFYSDDGLVPSTPREITYEIEWVMFMRPLLEHPAFRIGGGGAYVLTTQDVVQISKWEQEPDSTKRYTFEFDDGTGNYSTLSTNAQKYANGILLGQETYEDYAPVVRKTTTYTGGPPTTTTAGQKDTPPSIPGKPSGYQWRKSADRAVRAGGQTRWERAEEWIGAKKILSDRDEIFW